MQISQFAVFFMFTPNSDVAGCNQEQVEIYMILQGNKVQLLG